MQIDVDFVNDGIVVLCLCYLQLYAPSYCHLPFIIQLNIAFKFAKCSSSIIEGISICGMSLIHGRHVELVVMSIKDMHVFIFNVGQMAFLTKISCLKKVHAK